MQTKYYLYNQLTCKLFSEATAEIWNIVMIASQARSEQFVNLVFRIFQKWNRASSLIRCLIWIINDKRVIDWEMYKMFPCKFARLSDADKRNIESLSWPANSWLGNSVLVDHYAGHCWAHGFESCQAIFHSSSLQMLKLHAKLL